MKFLSWLRNTTSTRHFFIFVLFAIGLSCLYAYALYFGSEKLGLSAVAFKGIMAVFILHWAWIFLSAVAHFIKKEWKPGIGKSILCMAYGLLIYYLYGFSIMIFYGVAASGDYKIPN